MKIEVQQLWPGEHAPGTWKTVGRATSWLGAERIARREHDPRGFGEYRHPGGGPRYGTLRAVTHDGVYLWEEGLGYVRPANDEA